MPNVKLTNWCLFLHLYGCRYVDALKILVSRYHSVMDSLNEVHLDMLALHIERVKREIKFGLKILNWSSLGVYILA